VEGVCDEMLLRVCGLLKASLNLKVSSGDTTGPLGVFTSTRACVRGDLGEWRGCGVDMGGGGGQDSVRVRCARGGDLSMSCIKPPLTKLWDSALFGSVCYT
jgi:hypothetical protein